MLIGAVCSFLSFGLYAVSFDFWTILAAEMLLGVAFAFTSGADSALLHETLEDINETHTYRRVEGRLQGFYTLAESVAAIAGGYLALISIRAPLTVQVGIAFLMIPIAFSLREARNRHRSSEAEVWTMRRAFVETVYHNAYLRWLLIWYAVVSTTGLIVVWFRQSYFELLHVPLELYGYLWAALMLIVSLANVSADRIARAVGERNILYVVMGLGIGAFTMLGTLSIIWVLAGLALLACMRGLLDPVVTTIVQREAVPQVRATVLSIRSFAVRGLFALTGPVAGWASDVYSLDVAIMATGITFGVCGFVILYLLVLGDRRVPAHS